MPAPYSEDFRERAIAAVDRGEKKARSVECYKLAETLAERWTEEISRITIGKALKRIGFTRKKNLRNELVW